MKFGDERSLIFAMHEFYEFKVLYLYSVPKESVQFIFIFEFSSSFYIEADMHIFHTKIEIITELTEKLSMPRCRFWAPYMTNTYKI